MMHLHMIGLAGAIAICCRLLGRPTAESNRWQSRWHRALIAFVVPPLLLLATAVAIITMGTSTAYAWEGRLSYGLGLGFVVMAMGRWIQLGWQALQTRHQIRRYPQSLIETNMGQTLGRVVEVPTVFSAQIGLWSSDLVVSRGLLAHLDSEHLEAVLAHESGHAHYRDTFWFFWLGGLRRLTGWLPYTEALWQELLLLREVRADCWAACQVDTLVLAESLMSVITAALMESEAVCAGFSCAAPRSRLAQRVDALLAGDLSGSFGVAPWQWATISLALSPLLTIPFHY
ncbi:MAG: M56 family metallopeptidase [Phormidesmis sp.]